MNSSLDNSFAIRSNARRNQRLAFVFRMTQIEFSVCRQMRVSVIQEEAMKWIRSETIAVLTVIVGMLAASASYSQNTNSGDIRGTVTDSSGAVVPDAIVTVLDLEKGVTKDFKTNSDGLFDTGPLVTGQYKGTFSHPGFGNFVRSSLTLDVQTVTINATLKPGEVTTEVVVTTDVPLIQTESGDQSRILDHREMQNLPNPNQDWENFVKLIPGATGTASYSSATGQ